MTQEDKELLLKDLCARLPYGVNCYNADTEEDFILSDVADIDSGYPTFDYGYGELVGIKPYLRPMSSMTGEEFEEYTNIIEHVSIGSLDFNIANPDAFDWLNAHHFDYRGLIEKGLALEAPKDMYRKVAEK